ncbi:ABC transporter permease [Sphingomonas sp.]|uniref:ABC transporter permease n=1 Tax=Sphingomonas sp. TaxID=28214 RepID=UPI001B1F9D4B|nr:ABC transporter permease [Sphingomonas sp.]MBO9713734.1 ABC transporter permease [Sphingomonas sp.]
MKAVLLVAVREIRQILATRGFWVMLLIVPVALAASIVASTLMAPQPTVAYTLVDASGRFDKRIQQRLEIEHQRDVLRALSSYVERWKLGGVAPGEPWAQPGAWMADGAVQRFVAEGGVAAAERRIAPHVPREAPPFKAPARDFVRIPPPHGASAGQGAAAFGAAVADPLKGDVETPEGKRPFALAVYIPKDFGTSPTAVVQMWTSGRYPAGLIEPIRAELTSALRLQALQAGGLSPLAAAQVETLVAPVRVAEPPAGKGRGPIVTKSFVPLALVYLLLITAITTGSMMLQGVVEERSNKLLESVLACVRPTQLMQGKLLGLGAVGLGIIAVWAGCAVAAAFSSNGFVADVLRPSIEAIEGPWIVLAMLFYFLAGYLVLAMLFLAIGSLSDSMQDAQSYLMPVLLLVMIPVMIMMQASLRSPDALITQILSWIPLYTPFAMLARLGTGVSLVEVIGTTIVLLAFVALELVLLGRLFQASLLSTGQPVSIGAFTRLLLQAPEK